jgi:hypothetical protein
MTSLQRSTRWMVLLLVIASAPACADDIGQFEPDAAPASAEPDAAPGAPDAAAVGGLAFLAVCTSNAECASGLCFNFNAKGLHCTHTCQSATDCEAPSPGCNGMNVCKAP